MDWTGLGLRLTTAMDYYCGDCRRPFLGIVLGKIDLSWIGRMVTLELLFLVEPLSCGHFEAGNCRNQ